MHRWTLPKTIRFPGFKIHIEESVMTEDEYSEFAYSANVGVIRLRLGMTKKQQQYYLSHELCHVVDDYQHMLILGGAGP